MDVQFSVAVRTAEAAAIKDTIGASPKGQMWSGTMPANCAAADAEDGAKLAEIACPATAFGDASAGAIAKAGDWLAAGLAAGYITHFRLKDAAGTVCHLQALVSEPWAGSTSYALTQQAHNGGNVYRCVSAGESASSGGPTGTGSGITDGGVTWDYVGAEGVPLDATAIDTDQALSLDTLSFTVGNE